MVRMRARSNAAILAGLALAATTVFATVSGILATPAGAAGGGRPLIHAVSVSGSAGDYTLTVEGHGLGGSTVTLPYTGDVGNFRVEDEAQAPDGEWGFTADDHVLRYLVWKTNEIEVTGLGATPGDALVVAEWNAVSGQGVTWAGNVPPAPGPPSIRSVAFSSLGTPVALRMVVKGDGFGAAPVSLPYVGDVPYLSFWDGVRCDGASGFSAGGTYFGQAPADAVTLRIATWTDTKIVTMGFRGSYGSGCARVRSGDPVAVTVWSTTDTAVTGPQTAKRALILYGIPGN